ncbi:MAG: proline--tRNA ligase, partial [Clostridiales bacterium]|nr:proline--tRNA ligase [Clostridiales bacterium]
SSPEAELKKEYTPDCKAIEDVCTFLKRPVEESCKAVIYQINATDEYVIVFIRGDYEVNETKLTNLLGEKIHPAVITEDSGIVAGFCGPIGLKAECKVIYDKSLQGIENLLCGANETDYHYTGMNIKRDVGDVSYNDVSKIQSGGICPVCGKKSIRVSRGIEAGNIFQLGTKYTQSMGMTYTDENGEIKTPIMGCYGIGVGRMAACIMESRHDDKGPIWPISIAPWQVHLCCMRADDAECKAEADRIYDELLGNGTEVIYDDRQVSAGFMFADADLLGVPVRVVVGPKALKDGEIELSTRDKSVNRRVKKEEILSEIATLIDELNAQIDAGVIDRI